MTALDVAAHLALYARHPAVTRAHLDAEHRNACLALGLRPLEVEDPAHLHRVLTDDRSYFPEEAPPA